MLGQCSYGVLFEQFPDEIDKWSYNEIAVPILFILAETFILLTVVLWAVSAAGGRGLGLRSLLFKLDCPRQIDNRCKRERHGNVTCIIYSFSSIYGAPIPTSHCTEFLGVQ